MKHWKAMSICICTRESWKGSIDKIRIHMPFQGRKTRGPGLASKLSRSMSTMKGKYAWQKVIVKVTPYILSKWAFFLLLFFHTLLTHIHTEAHLREIFYKRRRETGLIRETQATTFHEYYERRWKKKWKLLMTRPFSFSFSHTFYLTLFFFFRFQILRKEKERPSEVNERKEMMTMTKS